MCQKCQIQTDENGAFSPGTRDAQAVCCFLLWLWGPNEGWEGKKHRERQREGKRARKSELFSQTWSLSLTKLRAPKPQCCLVPKGTTLQKLTSKRGWSRREEDSFIETNKQTSQPYCNSEKRATFYGLNLVPLRSTNQLDFNFCIALKSIFDRKKYCLICSIGFNMKCFLL